MKKKLLLLLISLTCLRYGLIAQNTSKWEVELNYAYQFDLNERSKKIFNNDNSLHQYGVSVKRVLADQKRFQILSGIGYARQQVLGSISINHCYGMSGCHKVLITQKNYTVELAEVPLSIRFAITEKWGIDVTGTSQFRFYQNGDHDLQSKFLFELNSIAIYPAIAYQYQNWRFSLGSRLLNWQQPDEIFHYNLNLDFSGNIPYFYKQALYYYNPFQLKFAVAAQF